jgi:hypothetical protein
MSRKSHPVVRKVFSDPYPFEIFSPSGSGPRPVIFQTPILGRFSLFEDLFFERRWARFFAEQGIDCVLIYRPIFEFDNRYGLDQIHDYLERSLKRNQAVLDHVFQEKLADPRQAGSYGISFGSMVNCIWASQEKRLGVNVFALAGGDFPEIFMESRDPLMASYREAALACSGNNPKLLRRDLQDLFLLDPLRKAPEDPDTTLLVLARFDRVVPYRCGLALREKLGNPRTITLPLGHYLSMFASPGLKWKVVRFFKEKFGISER